MSQVHKVDITTIENTLPGRDDINLEIFGMEGVPANAVASHNQRIATEYANTYGHRPTASNNQNQAGGGEPAAKKIKKETPEELKARLAAWRAKKAAEKAAGGAGALTGVSTPNADPNTPNRESENGTPSQAGQAADSPGAATSVRCQG